MFGHETMFDSAGLIAKYFSFWQGHSLMNAIVLFLLHAPVTDKPSKIKKSEIKMPSLV